MIIPNYEIIHELDGNDWYALHKGRRLEDQTPVLLKTARRNPQGAADVELLEREFETRRELFIEGVPRVYELLRHACGAGWSSKTEAAYRFRRCSHRIAPILISSSR